MVLGLLTGVFFQVWERKWFVYNGPEASLEFKEEDLEDGNESDCCCGREHEEEE